MEHHESTPEHAPTEQDLKKRECVSDPDATSDDAKAAYLRQLHEVLAKQRAALGDP